MTKPASPDNSSRSGRPPAAKPKTRKIFNLRLLACTLIAAAIVLPAVYWWRAYQERRTAGALLDRAEELRAEEKYTAAAGYLFRYLQLQPDNAEARALLAATFDRSVREAPDRPIRSARSADRAIALYQQALGVASTEQAPALRRALTQLLLETRKFTSAREEAGTLLDPEQGGDADDAFGWQAQAQSLYGEYATGTLKSDRRAVGAAFARAVALNPGKVDLAATLGHLYRAEPQLLPEDDQALTDAERQQRADEILDRLVAANPKQPEVYLARYTDRARSGKPRPKEDLQAALEYGPQNVTVLLVAASEARREAEAIRSSASVATSSKPESKPEAKPASTPDSKPAPHADAKAKELTACYKKASALYERAIQAAKPYQREEKEEAYLGLAQVCLDQQQPPQAIEALQRGLRDVGAESVAINSQLAAVLIDEGKLSQAEEALTVLDRIAEHLGQYVSPTAKAASELANALLRARLLAKQEKRLPAIALARRVVSGQKGVSAAERRQALEAWWLLGSQYEALGRRDQAAEAYEQAWTLFEKLAAENVAARQMGLRLHLQAAAAWLAAGRPERAADHYAAALRSTDAGELWLALARAQLQQIVRLPKEERNWAAFQKVLSEVTSKNRPKPLADPWQVELLRTEAALIQAQEQGKTEEGRQQALEVYRAAEKQYPQSVKLLQVLAVAYEQLGAAADTDRVLAAIDRLPDSAVTACLLRSRVCCLRKEYDQARQTLRAGLASAPAEARAALERELIDIDRQDGKLAAVRKELTQLAEQRPADVDVVCQLAELALAEMAESNSQDPEALKQRAQYRQELEACEKKLRDLEGAGGAYAPFYEARRLMAEAQGANDQKLTQARDLLARAQGVRPTWPAVRLVQGELCERQGKFEEAVEAYEEAIRLGEGRPVAYERLIGLLYQMDRTVEADRYVGLLENRVAGSEKFSSLEMILAAGRGQVERALSMARQRVERRPQDPLAQMWLGQMLLANDKSSEAEAALKKAVAMAPNDVRTLGALVGFYVRGKQIDQAKALLQQVAKNQELSALQRALLQAQGHELLGDREEAKRAYREAAQQAPRDTAVQTRFAGFLLQSATADDTQEAERVLRGMLKQSAGTSAARLMLAELLVARGGERQWEEAQQLMARAGMEPSPSNVGLRAQAILWARRGGRENLDKAQKILEKLAADPKRSTVTDRWWLARVYEAGGKWQEARAQYQKLAERTPPDPIHLAAYVNLLLRRKAWAEADKWIKKVEELLPDDLGTAALRARWLRGQGETAKIEPSIEPLADKLLKKAGNDTQQQSQLALRVGDVYSAVQQYAAAERWYRRLMQSVPEAYQRVAVALARQGRLRAAIELCVQAAGAEKAATPRPAMALVSVLLAGQPTAEDYRLAEPLLARTLQEQPKDLGVLLGVAGVRVSQQQTAEATRLYRQALALQPKNPSILNNLATLLAEQGDEAKRQEALDNVDQAIKILGPQPFLLDTKGMILVLADRREEALPLLQEAVATIDPDPRYRFHLAVAHDRVGDAKEATAALKESLDGELKQQILTPTDWKLLAELEKKLLPAKNP